MRHPVLRASFDPSELVVDNFAGGGGASTGIEAAIGRPIDLAINHDPEAIALHAANHPETKHFCENIWEVDPVVACGSRPVGLAWFSPDCTHFSRAKAGTPLKKEIRGLAWVVIRWAKAVAPRIIVLENVEEFQTWGPLGADGFPDATQVGSTFRAWLAELSGLGYSIEFTTLVAADYGTPTTRKRLYLVARRDQGGIAWPERTHGKGLPESWRPASEIIDWSLPCPSIFDRARPLAEATQRRIAEGIRRFVLECGNPFVIPASDGMVIPTMIQTGYGERPGQKPRALNLHEPLGTVVAGGAKHGLIAALVTKHQGGPNGHQAIGHSMTDPMATVKARDSHGLTTAFLTKFYGTSIGSTCDAPVPTVTGGGGHLAQVRAFLVKYYSAGGNAQGQDLLFPLHTVTSKARFGLVTIHGEEYQIADIGMRMLQPHELYAAQGFPSTYNIAPEFNGKPLTKTAQIRMAGNSVCPPVARAIVQANVYNAPIQVAA